MDPIESRNQLTITLGPREWYSANDRLHHMDRHRRSKTIRAKAKMLARDQLSPVTGPVLVTAFIAYPRAGRADPSNAACIKHVLDGITDAGIWEDDDSEHVIAVGYRRDPDTRQQGTWRIRLVLTPQDHKF